MCVQIIIMSQYTSRGPEARRPAQALPERHSEPNRCPEHPLDRYSEPNRCPAPVPDCDMAPNGAPRGHRDGLADDHLSGWGRDICTVGRWSVSGYSASPQVTSSDHDVALRYMQDEGFVSTSARISNMQSRFDSTLTLVDPDLQTALTADTEFINHTKSH